MASTVLSYKDRHVAVPEPPVIGVAYMLFHEASLDASTPEEKARFQQMASDFFVSTIGLGCSNLGLDGLLQGDRAKEAEFLTFVNLARGRLLGFGDTVALEYVNQVIAPHDISFKNICYPTPWLHKILDLIEALIRGGRLPPSDWLTNFRRGTFPSNRFRRGKH
jgi:hypothetical protein